MDEDQAGLNLPEEKIDPAERALVPASPRLTSLKRDAQLLLDELVRRVQWVRRAPGRARTEIREHGGQLTVMLAGGALLSGAALALLLQRRRARRRGKVGEIGHKLRLLGALVANPEAVVKPPMRVTVGRSIVASVLSTLAGELVRRVMYRLNPPRRLRRLPR